MFIYSGCIKVLKTVFKLAIQIPEKVEKKFCFTRSKSGADIGFFLGGGCRDMKWSKLLRSIVYNNMDPPCSKFNINYSTSHSGGRKKVFFLKCSFVNAVTLLPSSLMAVGRRKKFFLTGLPNSLFFLLLHIHLNVFEHIYISF